MDNTMCRPRFIDPVIYRYVVYLYAAIYVQYGTQFVLHAVTVISFLKGHCIEFGVV